MHKGTDAQIWGCCWEFRRQKQFPFFSKINPGSNRGNPGMIRKNQSIYTLPSNGPNKCGFKFEV